MHRHNTNKNCQPFFLYSGVPIPSCEFLIQPDRQHLVIGIGYHEPQQFSLPVDQLQFPSSTHAMCEWNGHVHGYLLPCELLWITLRTCPTHTHVHPHAQDQPIQIWIWMRRIWPTVNTELLCVCEHTKHSSAHVLALIQPLTLVKPTNWKSKWEWLYSNTHPQDNATHFKQ